VTVDGCVPAPPATTCATPRQWQRLLSPFPVVIATLPPLPGYSDTHRRDHAKLLSIIFGRDVAAPAQRNHQTLTVGETTGHLPRSHRDDVATGMALAALCSCGH